MSDLAAGAIARDATLMGCGCLIIGVVCAAIGFGVSWLMHIGGLFT